eukprot:COSAG03_NODE_2040_length_3195_cov_14.095284_3_plen_96_part_00
MSILDLTTTESLFTWLNVIADILLGLGFFQLSFIGSTRAMQLTVALHGHAQFSSINKKLDQDEKNDEYRSGSPIMIVTQNFQAPCVRFENSCVRF